MSEKDPKLKVPFGRNMAEAEGKVAVYTLLAIALARLFLPITILILLATGILKAEDILSMAMLYR